MCQLVKLFVFVTQSFFVSYCSCAAINQSLEVFPFLDLFVRDASHRARARACVCVCACLPACVRVYVYSRSVLHSLAAVADSSLQGPAVGSKRRNFGPAGRKAQQRTRRAHEESIASVVSRATGLSYVCAAHLPARWLPGCQSTLSCLHVA